MASMIKVTGVGVVTANLQKASVKMGLYHEINMKRAGLFLQRMSQQIVPVATSNLKNSAFTRNVGGPGWMSDVIVGYTAPYAVYVHERLDLQHKEGKSAKFLENPLREHRGTILKIIAGKM